MRDCEHDGENPCSKCGAHWYNEDFEQVISASVALPPELLNMTPDELEWIRQKVVADMMESIAADIIARFQ